MWRHISAYKRATLGATLRLTLKSRQTFRLYSLFNTRTQEKLPLKTKTTSVTGIYNNNKKTTPRTKVDVEGEQQHAY